MKMASYERVLERQGVTFRYLPKLMLDHVDVKAGLANQARLLDPLDEELTSQYTAWYKDSLDRSRSERTEFVPESPAIVVYKKRNKSSWVPMDGNQRIYSAKAAGVAFLDAYEVQSDDPMILDRITWSFNNLVNGKRLSRDECIEHALTMVQKYNVDAKQASLEWNVPLGMLRQRLTANKLRDVLRARSVPQVCGLSDSKLDKLSPLLSLGEDVFTNAAQTTYRCGLAESDIDVLKKEVGKAKTIQEKCDTVMRFNESDLVQQRRAETKGGTVSAKARGLFPSERLFRHLKTIERLQREFDKTALTRGANFKEIREVAADVVHRLIVDFGLGALPRQEAGTNGKS